MDCCWAWTVRKKEQFERQRHATLTTTGSSAAYSTTVCARGGACFDVDRQRVRRRGRVEARVWRVKCHLGHGRIIQLPQHRAPRRASHPARRVAALNSPRKENVSQHQQRLDLAVLASAASYPEQY